MKFAINLYQDSLKPVTHWLTLTNLAIAAGAVMALCLAWYGKAFVELSGKQEQIRQVAQEVEQAKQELKHFQQALIQHQDTAKFNQQKLKLESSVMAKKLLLEAVANRDEVPAVDYYRVMKDLTEHHDHDLWLTRFSFSESQVFFDGFALTSRSVTNWLTYLQSSQSFKGREFSHLTITSVNDEVLGFQAGTQAPVSEGEGN